MLLALPGSSTPLRGAAASPARAALATVSALHAKPAGVLPRRGVLVDGRSLAGVSLGDTMAKVRALWGHHFTRCEGCKPAEWFYFLPSGDPAGAGVQFSQRPGRRGRLHPRQPGRPRRPTTGLRVGAILANPLPGRGDGSRWQICTGFAARSSEPAHGAVTSILTQGAAVYGFALTRPSISPCM